MNNNASGNSLRENQVSFLNENGKMQSLKDKTGATAQEIREAIEKLGFDREKVEEYLLKKKVRNN